MAQQRKLPSNSISATEAKDNEHASQPDCRVGFQDLSPDIRNYIYDLYYDVPQVYKPYAKAHDITILLDNNTSNCGCSTPGFGLAAGEIKIELAHLHRPPTGLGLTSKGVRAESAGYITAIADIWATSVFVVNLDMLFPPTEGATDPGPHGLKTAELLNHLTEADAARIRCLEFRTHKLDQSANNCSRVRLYAGLHPGEDAMVPVTPLDDNTIQFERLLDLLRRVWMIRSGDEDRIGIALTRRTLALGSRFRASNNVWTKTWLANLIRSMKAMTDTYITRRFIENSAGHRRSRALREADRSSYVHFTRAGHEPHTY